MELELREIFQIIFKRLWIIVTIAVFAILTSGFVSFFILDKIYQTSTTLIVNKPKDGTNQNSDIMMNDILVSQKLVKTYSVIVKSDTVLEQVIRDLQLDMKPSDLRSHITVAAEGETEILRITVENEDPERAQKIANTIAQVFPEEVKRILQADNVQIIDPAKLPENPVKPRPLLNIVIAAMIGIMTGMGVIFLIEYLDNTIKTPEDVQHYLGLPVMGAIPSFDE
jgi:capsular polysaccharide biosynthesis protein